MGLTLHRAGDDQARATILPPEVDPGGRVVCAWGDCLSCLAPGLYVTTLISAGVCCGGEVLLQLARRVG